MKAKKWLTFITFGCSILALASSCLVGKASGSIAYDIAMAVFGSALLGFIMSLIEYLVERKHSMEVFWDEGRKALTALRKYHYIDIDPPVEMVLSCFQEEWSNGFRHVFDPTPTDDAKDALIGWYEENVPMAWTENDDISAELDKYYETQMEAYRREFTKSIESSVAVANLDLGQLGNAYGSLDFMFGNSSVRKDAYSKVYNKIVEYRNLARTELYHFNMLLEGAGNFPVCAQKAYAICQKVFVEEIKIELGFETKVVYQTVLDDIDDALEDFRCKIYRHLKPEYPERVPICGKGIIFDTEE